MRALVVNTTIDRVTGGGTAEKTFQLARAFVRLGVSTSLLTTDVGLTDERRASLEGCRLEAVRCLWRRYGLPLLLPGRIKGLVRRADVVLMLSHWSVLNLAAARACRSAGVPYAVCPSGALPIFGRSGGLKRAFNAAGGRRMIREANAVIATTRMEIADIRAYDVPTSRIPIIPNGVETVLRGPGDGKAFRATYGIGAAPFVLFLGRLNPIKGPDLLLEAWLAAGPATTGYQLVFAGLDEGLGASLRRRAAASGVAERVHFTGHLAPSEKADALREAALLALPSRMEAMSMVALEAGAAGLPVLLTDACGFPEVETVGGGLVVPATIDGLRQGLVLLLSRAASLPAMGQKLRSWVLAEFALDSIARKYLELFESASFIRGV